MNHQAEKKGTVERKPWLLEKGGRQLEGFLGAYGVKTSRFETTEEIVAEACRLFGVPRSSRVTEVSLAIDRLGKEGRKRAAGVTLASRQKSRRSGSNASSDRTAESELLHQVVMAVINRGLGEILSELPDVLAYYGAAIPTVAEVMDVWPEMIEGDVHHGDLVYSFRVARPVKAQVSAPADTQA